MSDGQYVGTVIVVCLLIWCAIALAIAAIWAAIAHRTDPWERLADQLQAAREWEA